MPHRLRSPRSAGPLTITLSKEEAPGLKMGTSLYQPIDAQGVRVWSVSDVELLPCGNLRVYADFSFEYHGSEHRRLPYILKEVGR